MDWGLVIDAAVGIAVVALTLLLWRIEKHRETAKLVIEGFGWAEDDAFSISITNVGGHDTGIRSFYVDLGLEDGSHQRYHPEGDPMGAFEFPLDGIIVRSGERYSLRVPDGCWSPENLDRDARKIAVHVVPVLGRPVMKERVPRKWPAPSHT